MVYLLVGLPESGRTKPRQARAHGKKCLRTAPRGIALSFIRTVTVGPGIQPGLLTPRLELFEMRALAGLCFRHHRRWGVSPRPENACSSDEAGAAILPCFRPARCPA